MQKAWRTGSRFLLGDVEELMGIHLRKVCGMERCVTGRWGGNSVQEGRWAEHLGSPLCVPFSPGVHTTEATCCPARPQLLATIEPHLDFPLLSLISSPSGNDITELTED